MTLPLDRDIDVPVLVVLLEEPIAVVSGALVWLDAATYRLRLAGASATVGRRLVATVGSDRLPGRIVGVTGDLVSVARTEVHGADDRACPRMAARFPLTWSIAADAEALDAGSPSGGPARDAMSESLSVSGVSLIVASGPPSVGDRLRIAVVIDPGAAPYPLLAVVRRVDAIAGEWLIGAEFVEMDEATFDAFTDLTLRSL